MNTINTLPENQTVMMMHPAIEDELCRMAQVAEHAFYSNESENYTCREIQKDFAQQFALDTKIEHRYYLFKSNRADHITGLPFAALYAVNAYGIIAGQQCVFGEKAICALEGTVTGQMPFWHRGH